MLAPFQAYAALKGLLEVKEGGWDRTPKSGRITGTLAKLHLGRRLRQLLGARRRRPHPRPQAQGAGAHFKLLATGLWPRRWRSGLAYGALTVLLVALLWVGFEARNVTPVAALETFNLHKDAACLTTGTHCTMGTTPTAGSLLFDDATDDFTWDSELSYPTGGDPGQIPAGDYDITVYFTLSGSQTNKTIDLEFRLDYGSVTIGTATEQFVGGASPPRVVTISYGLLTLDENQPLQLRIRYIINAGNQKLTMYFDDPDPGPGQTYLTTPTIQVDELGWRLLLLAPLVPAVPVLMRVLRNRKARRTGA
jgi:hypothetical protein